MEKLETELPTAGSEPEAEPQDGPQVTSRLGPVRSGDGRTKSRFEGYVEHPSLPFENDSQEKVNLRRLGVSVLEDGGFRLPGATWSLEAACLPEWIRKPLFGNQPTPLQAVTWPLLRTNRDVVAIAEPGCGKTLAYAVPLLIRAAALQGARHEQPDWWQQKAWQEWRQRPPDGVILVPTSEVAQQVQEQIKPLASAGRVQVAGGTAEIGAEAQEKELSRAGVLVLTPWQLQCQSWALGKDEDLVALNQDVVIIFDEADDIIKDGDDEGTQARTVLDFMPKNRVLGFFSATWPRRTHEMARRHLRHDAVMVYATTECESNAAGFCLECRFVVQRFEVMNALSKQEKLKGALKMLQKRLEGNTSTVGVFCNKPETVNKVAKYLEVQLQVRVVPVHELMDHAECTQAQILVATSMLGRGYNFPKMQWLINYDMPDNLLEYMCRVRLASRCDVPGYSLTFLAAHDLLQVRELKVLLEHLGQDNGVNPELAFQHRPAHIRRCVEKPHSWGHHTKTPIAQPLPDADWKDWTPQTYTGVFNSGASGSSRSAVPDLICFD
ncbi:unnamed protein product [Durusdinium trenchii]|uniref:ATP-dependent RNA helicase n=1 Tax=Durusdinium trenchii TaxID=1381693 RepID=A0ABP0KPY6_9DINO